jgi:predicted acyltransferase
MSLDALRGFDMFWIAGVDHLVHALPRTAQTGVVGVVSRQLQHSQWRGFTFYDLVFPLFIFIVGISIVLSVGKVLERDGRPAAVKKIVVRALLLYLLGLFYYRGAPGGLESLKLVGVLQRIAVCYLCAAILFCFLRPRGLAIVCAALLLGYWALMARVPVRAISLEKGRLAALAAETGVSEARALYDRTGARVNGSFEEGMNLADHIDFLYVPFKKRSGHYDNEGLLSTLPGIALCLLGIFAGRFLRAGNMPDDRKVRWLLGAGLASVLLGWLWNFEFPVIKRLWTSSFVLVAAGHGCVLLAVFHQIIEVRGYRRWATPLLWIGMNPITVYMAGNIVDFGALAARFVGGPVAVALGPWAGFVQGLVTLALVLLLVRFLYVRRIFVRL